MWSNRYWAKTYWAGNYWTPTTTQQDVELLGGGGYVYIPAWQRRHKLPVESLVSHIVKKHIPKKKIEKDLEQLAAIFKQTIQTPQDIQKIDKARLLKEEKALEILSKIYVTYILKEDDELLVLLLLLDLV